MAKLIESVVPGAVVSPRWWEDIGDMSTDSHVPAEDAASLAEEQTLAVLGSDVLVLLSAPRGAGQGTHVELGIAIAGQLMKGTPVVIGVGRHESASIFHRLVTTWVTTWHKAVDALVEAA